MSAAEAHAAREMALSRRQEQSMRRLLQLELARAFGSWSDAALEWRRLVNATRRLRNPGLAYGWRSWRELIDERDQLRRAVARMRSPVLSHALRRWRQRLPVETAVEQRSRRPPSRWPLRRPLTGWAKFGVEKFKFYMAVWSRYDQFWIFSSSRLDSTVSIARTRRLESSVRPLGPNFRTCCPR